MNQSGFRGRPLKRSHEGFRKHHAARSLRDETERGIRLTGYSQTERDPANKTGIHTADKASGRLEQIRAIDALASRVWELLGGVHSIEEIAGKIASEFGLSHERAVRETQGFIEIFGESKLSSVTR